MRPKIMFPVGVTLAVVMSAGPSSAWDRSQAHPEARFEDGETLEHYMARTHSALAPFQEPGSWHFGVDSPWSAYVMQAERDLARGRIQEAEAGFESAIANARGRHKDDRLVYCYRRLGQVHFTQGEYAEAESLFACALGIRECHHSYDDPELLDIGLELAATLHAEGKFAEGEALFSVAVAVLEQRLGPNDPGVAVILCDLANAHYELGSCAEAELEYGRALSIWSEHRDADAADVARTQHNLARVYAAEGKFAEADALYKQAIATLEKKLGRTSLEVSVAMQGYAALLEGTGRSAEAQALVRQAIDIRFQMAMGRRSPGSPVAVLDGSQNDVASE